MTDKEHVASGASASGVAPLVARLDKLIGDGSFTWMAVETAMLREIVAELRVHAEGVTPGQQIAQLEADLDEAEQIGANFAASSDLQQRRIHELETELSALRAAALAPPSTWQADDILLVVSLYNRGYAVREIIRRLDTRPAPPAASSEPT